MKEIQYKKFSWQTHKNNWKLKRPNVCQFELTYRCGLRCQHCYTDCYNRPECVKKELSAKGVKKVLDKVYDAGVVWVCFTGGDPLIRKDFLDIYSYSKDKGFIITIFTNAYSMTEEIIGELKERPPFVIEMTLNGVTKETYEKISRIKGSFEKVMYGINLILKAKIPLKIKTQITKDNLKEIPEIQKFVEGLGLRFKPSIDLHARLNGELAPCNLRISPEEVLLLNGKGKYSDDNCRLPPENEIALPFRPLSSRLRSKNKGRTPRSDVGEKGDVDLYRCAIGGGDGINLDPYGNMFLCNLIRKPAFNLLETEIEEARKKLFPLARGRKFTPLEKATSGTKPPSTQTVRKQSSLTGFTTDSKCAHCKLRETCHWCPGRALVEMKDMETPIEYYCKLAHIL